MLAQVGSRAQEISDKLLRMTSEKTSTLRLLRQGMGNQLMILEDHGTDDLYQVRAHLPQMSEGRILPILFLLTSLAFLEAHPVEDQEGVPIASYKDPDGWLATDFLSHLNFEGQKLRISLVEVRGRKVATEITVDAFGDLSLVTRGRGHSASRWIAYVQGRPHLKLA